MDFKKEILHELRLLRKTIEGSQSEMCNSKEAIRILGLTNVRELKILNDKGVLPRYSRGGHFVYKRSECEVLLEKLNNEEVKIPVRRNNNKAA